MSHASYDIWTRQGRTGNGAELEPEPESSSLLGRASYHFRELDHEEGKTMKKMRVGRKGEERERDSVDPLYLPEEFTLLQIICPLMHTLSCVGVFGRLLFGCNAVCMFFM